MSKPLSCPLRQKQLQHVIGDYESDSPKFNVRSAISRHSVTGQHVFQEQTVKSSHYLHMLQFAAPQTANTKPFGKMTLLRTGAWRYENFWAKFFHDDGLNGTDEFHDHLAPRMNSLLRGKLGTSLLHESC